MPSGSVLSSRLRSSEGDVAHSPAPAAHTGRWRWLALAVVHLFYSGVSWQTMRDLWGLSGVEAGRAAAWGMRVILAELRRNPKSLQEGRR